MQVVIVEIFAISFHKYFHGEKNVLNFLLVFEIWSQNVTTFSFSLYYSLLTSSKKKTEKRNWKEERKEV